MSKAAQVKKLIYDAYDRGVTDLLDTLEESNVRLFMDDTDVTEFYIRKARESIVLRRIKKDMT